jgi:hypothetical protein
MKTWFFFSALLTAFMGMADTALAQDRSFAENHPHLAEANQHMKSQVRHIHHEVKNGDLKRRTVHDLHRLDDHVTREVKSGDLKRRTVHGLHRVDNHLRKVERKLASGDEGHPPKPD